MAEKVPPKPGIGNPSVRFGQVDIPVVDPLNVLALGAEVITEAREMGGVVALGFAAIRADGGASPDAIVCARLRLSMPAALYLRNTLDSILKASMPAKSETH